MMRAFSSLLALSSVLSLVSAHGYVSEMTIGSKVYYGNNPYTMAPKNSPLRKIDAVEPVKLGQDDHNLVCGKNAQVATDVAEAAAGDEISLKWVAGDGVSGWIHDKGPVFTYMASCGDVPCNEFDASKARWFKTEQKGIEDVGTRAWYQGRVYRGEAATTRIPANLAPGNYLLRHEFIALHIATFVGGAEFYINCAQLKVTGTGTGKPTESELVSIPGLYKPDDDGIVYAIDSYPMAPFSFPGPPLAALAGGNSLTEPKPKPSKDDKPKDDKPASKPPALAPAAGGANLTGDDKPKPAAEESKPKPVRSCESKRKARREALRKRDVASAANAANDTSSKVRSTVSKAHHNAVKRRSHGGLSRF